MRYEIIFAPGAAEDIAELRAIDRAKVLDAIETHLRYEPEKVSKSRIKRLKKLDWPQYCLRVDDIRVFYDVIFSVNQGSVEILAIKWLAQFGRRTADETGAIESGEE